MPLHNMNEPLLPERLILTGFMAAGKSTIGQILANTIGYDFIDLDKYIVEKTGLQVSEIFSQFGETHFRSLEKECLTELLERKNILIALGGGTICFNQMVDYVKQHGFLIFLQVSKDALFLRIKSKTTRPLFLDEQGTILPDEQIRKKIDDIFEFRYPFYSQAHLSFMTNDQPIGLVVEQLKKQIIYTTRNLS